MPVAGPGRGFGMSSFGLEVAGKYAGMVASAEGGFAVGNVVEEKLGPGQVAQKHIGRVSYDDITVTCGAGMSKDFYDYVQAMFTPKASVKDGSIKTVDFDHNVVSELDYFQGRITEIGFPELDASAKGVARLTVKISPEYTRLKKGSGKLPPPTGQSTASRQLNADNFRLTIAGLDCTHVNKIEALTVKQKVSLDTVGEQRSIRQDSSNLEVPNLVVTLSEATAQSFHDWHKSFVIDGDNGAAKEKQGTLEFLAADMKEALFTLTFHGLGIFRLSPDKAQAGNENIRRITAEMYCQSMDFAYGKGVVLG